MLRNGKRERVVIVGGGFGGLYAARGLRRAPFDVTLVDRRNFHLFQPLLYQVATGGLSPADIAAPLRRILRRQKNVRVLMEKVVGFEPEQRRVLLGKGALSYDHLIVATGMRNHYFGNDHWKNRAPGLKSIEDATRIRSRVLLAFEEAEKEDDPEQRETLLSFVVIGAGPTGLELAGALGELARDTLRRDFRTIDSARVKVYILELGERILPSFPPSLSERAAASLERLGVEIRVRTKVVEIRDDALELETEGGRETLRARNVLWAAGVTASPLGERLARATGAATDRQGRVVVEADLTVPGHPEIFVVGDLAHFAHPPGAPLPGVAPVAMQQGAYVAGVLRARSRSRTAKPFRYRSRGNLATIGRSAAVADLGARFRFSGFFAWVLWLVVHLFYLIGFENRLLVFIQWSWNYFTWNRSARLIREPENDSSDTNGSSEPQ